MQSTVESPTKNPSTKVEYAVELNHFVSCALLHLTINGWDKASPAFRCRKLLAWINNAKKHKHFDQGIAADIETLRKKLLTKSDITETLWEMNSKYHAIVTPSTGGFFNFQLLHDVIQQIKAKFGVAVVFADEVMPHLSPKPGDKTILLLDSELDNLSDEQTDNSMSIFLIGNIENQVARTFNEYGLGTRNEQRGMNNGVAVSQLEVFQLPA